MVAGIAVFEYTEGNIVNIKWLLHTAKYRDVLAFLLAL